MARRSQTVFDTVKSEGALLPPDLLERIAKGGKDLDGLTQESYHLDKSEPMREAATQAYNTCRDAWQKFQKDRARIQDVESDTGVTVTRERWLLKFFEALGYGRLQAHKSIEIDGKTYPVSHAWGNTPFLLTSFKYDLDRAERGVFRSSPHSLMQELLNRSDDHLWTFISNGTQLRILRDNVSFTRAAYVEFDLEAMMDGEVYSDFVLLWLLCHQSRVEADKPEQCWLEKWHQAAKQRGTRALDTLRTGVEKAIEALGQGFLAHKGNRDLRTKLADGTLTTQDYYQQLLRLVYRFIFMFVAEDRDLLLGPKADAEARRRYTDHYALGRLRNLAGKRRGTRHSDLWQGVRLVLGLLYKGEPRLALPALGSWLFSHESTADLNDCELRNDHLLAAVRSLAFTQEGKVLRPVDYKNLGSEELGSVYESLLELHPDINAEAATFKLSAVTGSERKTTGSYYTPSSLINCLLDSALDPVVNDRLKGKSRSEAEQALLSLKICDPACGSGHFLIAAANRVAKRLAAIRTGDTEPSPADQRAAFRDVVGHCVYGVDINPMAVELCKVALWLESIDPGRPLSFLDHRILCGNSLIGATPRLLKEGIPDDALKPIEGDDKALCKEYKRRNKDEREGQAYFVFEGALPWLKLGNIPQTFATLDRMSDDSLEDLEAKERRYVEAVRSADYENARLMADAWCAAFVWKKTKEFGDAITESVFRRTEANPQDITPWMKQEIQRLRDQYQFFHWHLAFPDVFRVLGEEESAENERANWTGGFNLILGNPPWERIKLQEKEWFASRRPDIATAHNAARRRSLVSKLVTEDPALFHEFQRARRTADGQSHLIRNTGRYPLCGRGDINTYAVFAELDRALVDHDGRVGCIVPTGIATDEPTKDFFQAVIETSELESLLSFENEEFLFPGVHHSTKFSLMTLARDAGTRDSAKFIFYARRLSEIDDPARTFELSPADIQQINPNTRTCPVFRGRRDANITKAVAKRHPVLMRDVEANGNPWELRFATLFHMSGDSHLFRTHERLCDEGFALQLNELHRGQNGYVPLYEQNMIHAFDHRFASFEHADEHIVFDKSAYLNAAMHADPLRYALPRYWIPASELCATWSKKNVPCDWLIGFRQSVRTTDARTGIFTILPRVAAGHSINVAYLENQRPLLACVKLAEWNSFAWDYLFRQCLGGINASFFILKQIPTVAPRLLLGVSRFDRSLDDSVWLACRVIELSYTAWDLRGFGVDCEHAGPPFRWDDKRRFLIRCELDAAYFHLYNIARDDVDYIMETFPVVRRKDEATYGEYRTKRVILEMYDEMAEVLAANEAAVAAGQQPTAAYQTRVDPPPGPPADAEGNFLPLPQWLPGQPQPVDWPSHIHPPREVRPEELRPAAAAVEPVVMVDPAYPQTELEKAVCATVLALVEASPGMPSDTYLDAVILASQPDACEALLSGKDKAAFKRAATKIPNVLSAQDGQRLGWRPARDYLEKSQAIEITDRTGKQGVSLGTNHDELRTALPAVSRDFIPYLLKAAAILADARSDAAASKKLGGIVATIDGQADRERAISA